MNYLGESCVCDYDRFYLYVKGKSWNFSSKVETLLTVCGTDRELVSFHWCCTSKSCFAFSLNTASDTKAPECTKNTPKPASITQQQSRGIQNIACTVSGFHCLNQSPTTCFEYAFQSSHLHLFICKLAQGCAHVFAWDYWWWWWWWWGRCRDVLLCKASLHAPVALLPLLPSLFYWPCCTL